MKFKIFLVTMLLAAPAYASIEGWSSATSHVATGQWAFLWWTGAVVGATFLIVGILRVVHGFHWWRYRFTEPSTYLGIAIFLACGGLFANSLTLERSPLGEGLLLSATIFAFLGIIGKDEKGPLL